MLTITREGDIVTVVEEILSFTDTKRTVVKYNVASWEVQVGNEPWRKMNDDQRHWVVKHYLPKAKAPN